MGLFRRIVLLLVIMAAADAAAQERERPAIEQEYWAGFSLEGRPTFLKSILAEDVVKRLRTFANLGYRSSDSFFAGKQVYLEGAADYKVSDHVRVGGDFRYAYRANDADRQRACLQFAYKTEVDRLELGYRFDYQHNFRSYGETREVLRNRLSVGYNIPKFKFDPKFSVEFFQWAGYRGLIYFGTRYKLGTEWSPRKGHMIGLSVLHDRERMVFAPSYRLIASVDYTITLRKK